MPLCFALCILKAHLGAGNYVVRKSFDVAIEIRITISGFEQNVKSAVPENLLIILFT